MASEKVMAARAVPRGVAREFRESKWMTVLCAGLLAMVVMNLFTVMQGLMNGEEPMVVVVNALITFFVAFVAIKMVRLRQGMDGKQPVQASKAYLVFFIVQILYAAFMVSLYYSMHVVMHSGEIPTVTDEVIAQWDAMLPYYIFTVAIIVLQTLCACAMWRVLRGVSDLVKGQNPGSGAMTAASALCALTTGMLLCNVVLTLMMSGGGILGVVINLITALPELVYYFSVSQLCRQVSLRLKGQQ